MIRFVAALAFFALLSFAPVRAEDDEAALDFGGDAFRAGGAVIFDAADMRDAFLAGERIEVATPIGGSAHLAGRRVDVAAAVGGNLYAMGADITLNAAVAGNASLAGYDVVVAGPVEGNLRAAGSRVALRAPVGGAASITGRAVTIAAAVAGDAMIAAETLVFEDGARIDGRLILFEDPERRIDVPASVVSADRIDRREFDDRPRTRMGGPGWLAVGVGLVLGALVLAIIATIVAAVAPRSMTRLGAIVAAGPFRAFGAGFLTQAALIGGAILLAVTVIGIVVAPFALLASAILGLLGYVVAVYLLGVWVVTRSGALEPDTLPEYALAALVGALIAGALALLPFVGWLALFVLTLTGVGAIAIAALGPRYGSTI